MPKKQQSKKDRKGSKVAKVGHASQPLSNSAFNFFRDEIFPLDLLRLVIQYLPIKDILAFNKAYQKNQFSKYLTLACSGLLVYDGKLKRTQTLIWVVSSGLLFQELAIYPNKLSLELIPKSRHTLTSIDFSDTPVTSKVIPELIQCPQLTAVNFSHCSEITTSDITSLLSSRSNWRSINISCCDVDSSALASAGSLAQLRHLNISSNDWVTDETVALIARECPNLLTIDISHTNINGNDAVRDLLLNCGELQSFQSNGVWSLTSETRLLVFATICHRQLYSSDPEQNLKATETFLDLVEHGLSADGNAEVARGVARLVEFLITSPNMDLKVGAACALSASELEGVAIDLPRFLGLFSSAPPKLTNYLLDILQAILEETVEARDAAIAADIFSVLSRIKGSSYSLSSILSILLGPRPLPPNDQLEKAVPLLRNMLFNSSRTSHSESLAILSALSKDHSPELFQKFIDIQLFSPLFYLLRKPESSSSGMAESGLEIVFNFCSFSPVNCQYLICLGILPVLHVMLKIQTKLATRTAICRCLSVIASSCPLLLSFDVLLECGLMFQVISETKKKTPEADHCFLLLVSFATRPSHLAYLLHNDIILLFKSILHPKQIVTAEGGAIGTHDMILSVLEKMISAKNDDALPLIAAEEIQSMLGFELRKLMTSDHAEIARRAAAIMELEGHSK